MSVNESILNKYYIYRYIRLDTNTPFYIGKGFGSRYKNIDSRNKYFKNIIKSIPYEVEIILDNLTEEQSFNKEIEFIKLYKGLGYCEANLSLGGEGSSGVIRSLETRAKISLAKKGIPYSKETKYRMSLKHKKLTEEHKEKLGALHRKKIIDINTGYVYNSIKEAAISNNLKPGTLRAKLQGHTRKNNTSLRYYTT